MLLHLGPPSATTAYITKQELIQLYGKCGDSLHRGNVKKLLKQNQPLVNEPYKDIISSGQKILNLLATHLARLDRLEEQANHLRVPLAYASMLYMLRHHIELVREALKRHPDKEEFARTE